MWGLGKHVEQGLTRFQLINQASEPNWAAVWGASVGRVAGDRRTIFFASPLGSKAGRTIFVGDPGGAGPGRVDDDGPFGLDRSGTARRPRHPGRRAQYGGEEVEGCRSPLALGVALGASRRFASGRISRPQTAPAWRGHRQADRGRIPASRGFDGRRFAAAQPGEKTRGRPR